METNENTFTFFPPDVEEFNTIEIDFESDDDNLRWTEKPSQVLNVYWLFAIAASLVFAKWGYVSYWFSLVPLSIYLIRRLIIHCWWFHFRNNTIQERKGVFSVTTREVHYYRVKSVRLEQPFFIRIFGLSNLILVTSDPYIRTLKIVGLFHGREYMELVKRDINRWKKYRKITEHDIHPMM